MIILIKRLYSLTHRHNVPFGPHSQSDFLFLNLNSSSKLFNFVIELITYSWIIRYDYQYYKMNIELRWSCVNLKSCNELV